MFCVLKVPNSEAQSSTVVVTGTAASVAEAKVGLEERMEEIKAKMADDEVRKCANYFTLNPCGTDYDETPSSLLDSRSMKTTNCSLNN